MFGRLLLVMTLATGLSVPSSAEKELLELLPAAPSQGGALFLRLRLPEAGSPEVVWQKKSFPLYREGSGSEDRSPDGRGDEWVTALAISPDTPAGGHTVRVRYQSDGAQREISRKVEVRPVRFSVQNLKMAGKTAALYTHPTAKKEDAEVSAALRVRSDERLWSGDWLLPVKGRRSTAFGVQRRRNGKPVGRHRGLDLAAPTGTPIAAPAAARVVLSRSYKKYGHAVVLDHGMGITSLYMHMDARGVKEGQQVARGAKLGTVGSTGVATGPHLHWAVYLFGEPIEPGFLQTLGRLGIYW